MARKILTTVFFLIILSGFASAQELEFLDVFGRLLDANDTLSPFYNLAHIWAAAIIAIGFYFLFDSMFERQDNQFLVILFMMFFWLITWITIGPFIAEVFEVLFDWIAAAGNWLMDAVSGSSGDIASDLNLPQPPST